MSNHRIVASLIWRLPPETRSARVKAGAIGVTMERLEKEPPGCNGRFKVRFRPIRRGPNGCSRPFYQMDRSRRVYAIRKRDASASVPFRAVSTAPEPAAVGQTGGEP